ncbi:hypothetical protein [Nonomuraea sp. NPDC048826]|uniref:hypothetical protein n=1 Tax=Nonomuraea sp. NPDC048826 TaxID=3364347 RepID=UPI00372375BE
MLTRSIAAVLAALAVGVAGASPAVAGDRPWLKLAGTVGTVNDSAGVRLESYSVVWDGAQAHRAYLRKGDKFVRTEYRDTLVAPGRRWVAAVPDVRLWIPAKKIDLIDRRTGRAHTVEMPAPVSSPEWSADGRTLLFTAFERHRENEHTVIGFVTLNPDDRVPRLVEAGPRRRVSDWAVGHDHRFFFAGPGRMMARHDDRGKIGVYGMDGRRQRFYQGVGRFDERAAVSVVSPSGRLFATFLGEDAVGRGPIGIVDTRTGKIVHRLAKGARAFAGWYDDRHVIVKRARGRTQTFQRVAISGGATLDLVKEKLVVGVAEHEPHIERVGFVR